MSAYRSLALLLTMAFLLSCRPQSQEDLAPEEPDPQPPPAVSTIIDHSCTDTGRIPATWIDQARDRLRVGYGHTSHGSQPVSGMMAFRGENGSAFHFSYSDWSLQAGVFLNDYWGNAGGADDLGYDGDLGWRAATVEMLSLPGNDRNVVVWSWCGGVSDNSESGIQAYLNAMAGLEQDYPHVRFVYMTGHLDGTGASGNLHRRNEQIRAYCRANGKFLFDFADIESYAPGSATNYMALMADDNCDYDSDGNGSRDRNWAADWITANASSALARLAAACHECAHSQNLNCVLKGRAFWWLLARLAGWDGQ
ncbi:MAG: hypothetical protein JXO51_06040 [Candidatus Aminicenantes bacterium]|nr:hypothetical protein [Candidatus Aminicenantes bacterium]